MLTLLKGLPSTYNKDLQLDKSILFQTYDDLKLVFDLTLAVIDTLEVLFLIMQVKLGKKKLYHR